MTTFDAYAAKYGATVDESIKASGENSRYFARLKAGLAATRFGARPPRSVLDFGCGVGLLTDALLEAWPEASITGFDASEESIEMARMAFHDRPGATFIHGAGSTLPLASGSFDVIVAACVFHHIDRPQHAEWLAELDRVLRPGGTLFVFEHNPLNPLTRRAVASCPFDEGVVLIPPRYLEQLLRNLGFEQVSHSYYFFFPRPLARLRAAEPLLGWLPLGAQYCIQARTPAAVGGG